MGEKDDDKTPTPKVEKKKGPGHPKKGHTKVTGLPKKGYNTHTKVANQNVNTNEGTSNANAEEETMHAKKYFIEDEITASSGLNTTFRSWADLCDENEADDTTPPMHGEIPGSK